MKRKRVFFALLIFVSLLSSDSSISETISFTSKRKKGPSMNTLRESCCALFGDYLSQSAGLLGVIGKMQTISLQVIEEYMKSDKNSWCELASREKLTKYKQRLAHLNEKISELSDLCDSIAADFNRTLRQ